MTMDRAVAFTASCPACGRACTWRESVNFNGINMTQPQYTVGCDCDA